MAPRAARYADGSRDPEAWERFRSATTTPALIETVMRTGEPVTAEEPDSPLIAGWWADNFDVGAALAVPIGRPPEVVGVLTLDYPSPREFTEDELRLAESAGMRLGGIVERAREIEERTAHLNAATAVRRLLEEGSRALSAEQAGETLARVAKEALGVSTRA